MDLNENKHPRNFRFTKNTLTPLMAAGSVLIVCFTAVFLAGQSPAGMMVGAASQSPSATVPEALKVAPDPDPGSAAATTPKVTAEAVPADIGRPVVEDPASVPAEAAAPEPAPAAVPVGSGGGVVDSNEYVVVAGDTVGAIAARFGLDVYGMLAANGLGVYTIIWPGQRLKLSGPPIAVPALTPAVTAPAPAAAPVAAPAAAPAVRTIFVAGAGGQAMVDTCIGPIHFTPTDAYSLFITEHDWCGGWARFSGIGVGETVDMPGFGTYTVTGRGQVPQGGTTNEVAAVFGGFPRAILQTCIPGTNQMLLIALN
jgi:LysM repeat protein